jgi:uncharacterized protein involved in exopolysaccharide biosynthesis
MEQQNKTREIDIVHLIKKILEKKRQLAIVFAALAVAGVIIALATPKTYTAEVILAPEVSSGGVNISESLSDMASSFGIDLGMKSSIDAIYPEIYPLVFASNNFILDLFDVKVTLLEEKVTKTYRQHIEQDAPTPFWQYPMVWMSRLFSKQDEKTDGSGIDIFHLTKKEEGVVKAIRSSIACLVDKKTNVITINVTDYDRQVAAIVADTLQNRLQEYIIAYRTKKANHDLNYYTKLAKDSKEEYEEAKNKYTSYCDAHMGNALASVEARRVELENEMQARFNIYAQMNAQVQQSKAKVQENTPVFTLIQTSTVPNRASSMPRSFIVLLFVMLGMIANALWVLYKEELAHSRKGK